MRQARSAGQKRGTVSEQDDLTFQVLTRVYRDIDTVRRSMSDWQAPIEETNEFLQSAFRSQFDENGRFSRERGAASTVKAFASLQAFEEFFERLERQPEFEDSRLFLYRHDYAGPPEMGAIDSLEDFDVSPFGNEHNVIPTDTVVVPMSYFRGQPNELLRVLNHISQRFCLVFVHNDDPAFRISFGELTDWFGRDERLYVPVMPDLIPGFYRMEMPTSHGSWG